MHVPNKFDDAAHAPDVIRDFADLTISCRQLKNTTTSPICLVCMNICMNEIWWDRDDAQTMKNACLTFPISLQLAKHSTR